MAIKQTFGEKAFDAGNAAFLALLSVATIYPFIYVAFASISDASKMVAHTGLLLAPRGFDLGAYRMVADNPMIAIGYSNTLIYLVAGTCLNLLLTSFAAYGLSRKELYWKKPITFFIVFTMFFGGGLIPFFLLVKSLGLVNTRAALIIPTAVNTWNFLVMRTYFLSIPQSLEESARIDGAGDFRILFRIMLPLAFPVVAVMILFYGVGHWNAWFNAMIFLRKRDLYPLQLVLREILISSSTDNMLTDVSSLDKEPVAETVKYATVMAATLPILFVYPFLQKYFVKGMLVGAIKE